MNESRTILDLCGGTGSWSEPYKRRGYDVRVITEPIQDVRDLEYIENVHGVLCAPPCTVFAGSGARWERTPDEMREARAIVDACLRIVMVCKPKFWALENPVGTLRRWLGPPCFTFDPCDYGDPYTKRTLLWGDFNIPKFKRVEATAGSQMHLKYGGKSERTKRARSITPAGFARSFCEVNQ